MIYLSVCILLLCLSIHYDINEETRYKDFWYLFVLVVFILIAGLRYRLGVDTIQYMDWYYHYIPDLWHFHEADDSILSEPLYYLSCSIIKTFGGRFYVIQLIHALFVNVLLFKYIKKHSRYVFACLFLYFIWSFTSYMMETMRASMAIVICLFANDYILERKWLKGIILYLIAFGCHNSSILLLIITPLSLFLRFNTIGIFVLLLVPLIGSYIQNQLEDYIALFELEGTVANKAVGYMNNEEYRGEHNIFYYLVDIGVYIYSALTSFCYMKRHNESDNILKIQPFVMLGLIFVILQNSTAIFYRYVDYFKIYFTIFYIEFFVGYIKNTRIYTKTVSSLKMFVVFIPLFYIVVMRYSKSYVRYYPYSSVIERSISQEREHEYGRLRSDVSLLINKDEY